MDEKYVNALLDCLDSLTTMEDKINRYFYSNIDEIVGKRIILYGAGMVGKSYYNQFICDQRVILAAWTDRNYLELNNQYCLIKDPEIIRSIEFDAIVIAMLHFEKAQIVMDNLVKMGVPSEKIIWEKPKLRFLGTGRNKNDDQ